MVYWRVLAGVITVIGSIGAFVTLATWMPPLAEWVSPYLLSTISRDDGTSSVQVDHYVLFAFVLALLLAFVLLVDRRFRSFSGSKIVEEITNDFPGGWSRIQRMFLAKVKEEKDPRHKYVKVYGFTYAAFWPMIRDEILANDGIRNWTFELYYISPRFLESFKMFFPSHWLTDAQAQESNMTAWFDARENADMLTRKNVTVLLRAHTVMPFLHGKSWGDGTIYFHCARWQSHPMDSAILSVFMKLLKAPTDLQELNATGSSLVTGRKNTKATLTKKYDSGPLVISTLWLETVNWKKLCLMGIVPGVTPYENLVPEELFEQWQRTRFELVHRPLLEYLPTPPGRAIDIGAGSGRDAVALASLGYTVIAVEPWREMRILAAARHVGSGITWRDDSLPTLAKTLQRREQFDVILLSAVWMHLDASGRKQGMRTVSTIVTENGVIGLSIRHPADFTRNMYEVSADETAMLAEKNGLRVIHQCLLDDPLGRREVSWSYLCLRN